MVKEAILGNAVGVTLTLVSYLFLVLFVVWLFSQEKEGFVRAKKVTEGCLSCIHASHFILHQFACIPYNSYFFQSFPNQYMYCMYMYVCMYICVQVCMYSLFNDGLPNHSNLIFCFTTKVISWLIYHIKKKTLHTVQHL